MYLGLMPRHDGDIGLCRIRAYVLTFEDDLTDFPAVDVGEEGCEVDLLAFAQNDRRLQWRDSGDSGSTFEEPHGDGGGGEADS